MWGKTRTYGRYGFALGLLILVAESANAQVVEWEFDDSYDSNLVFVHPLVNYAINPDWVRARERVLFDGTSFEATIGSVTTQRLYTDARVRIDEGLGDTRFRFYYNLRWLDGEHLDTTWLQQFVGFEMKATGPLGLQAMIHPTPAKDDMDLAVGVTLTNDSRQRYLRALVRWDNFLWEKRNESGGTSVQEPVGIQWEGRWAGGSFEAFSEGRVQSESERLFPDSTQSPLVSGTQNQVNGSNTRLRWLSGETSYLELQLSTYLFVEGEDCRDPAGSFGYRNRILETVLRYVFPLGERWRAWPALHLIDQEAEAEGRRQYTFSRTDLMPVVFVGYSFSDSNMLELGYMGSVSNRVQMDVDPQYDLDRRSYADKIEIAWTHSFVPTARLQFSLSQEVTSGRFGGGNIQFMGLF